MREEPIITLLLVGEDLLVRQGLRLWLNQAADITVVGEASAGAEAVALAQALHPAVVLVDIAASTADGMAAAAALPASLPHSAVVLLSFHDGASTQARGHTGGAVTVVGKQEGVQALLAAIRAAGRQDRRSPGARP